MVNVDFEETGLDGIWFCDVPRMKAWAALTVEEDVTATLVDDVAENQCHGDEAPIYPNEAMYVDGLVWVQTGATLDLNGNNLITTELPLEDGTIEGDVILVVHKTCYGDFDNDLDVDLDDYAVFFAAITSTNDKTRNVLCDHNLDCDVDLADFGYFQFNFRGPDVPPGCACFEGGISGDGVEGSEVDVDALAIWCHANLRPRQLNELNVKLLTIAEDRPNAPDAPQMRRLAELLVE